MGFSTAEPVCRITTELGKFYLEDGDTVIIEKGTTDKITCPTAKGSAVGSPRG